MLELVCQTFVMWFVSWLLRVVDAGAGYHALQAIERTSERSQRVMSFLNHNCLGRKMLELAAFRARVGTRC